MIGKESFGDRSRLITLFSKIKFSPIKLKLFQKKLDSLKGGKL
jgi:hypothetical protein